MKKNNIYLIIGLFFSIIACNKTVKEKANDGIELKLISEFSVETITHNDKLNSKFAFSDSVLLIKSNSFNHSTESIADSSLIFLFNGKRNNINSNFDTLQKKFNLKITPIDSLLFYGNDTKANTVGLNIFRKSKSGKVFSLFNKKQNIKMHT